jgi:hypothetical protein
MLKYLFTAIYLGLLLCLLYEPIPIPDNDSMVDMYRPSIQLQLVPDNQDQATRKNFKADFEGFQKDSIDFDEYYILVDSTP